jgi:DNA (cytosine-5)-methyltransferase 1
MTSVSRPTFISLFAGCGGFDIGFKKAGYKSLGAFDIDQLPLDNLSDYAKSPIHQVDLTSASLPVKNIGNPDVILSGSPCQGFSTIGKRDFDDPRNTLLFAGATIATKLEPKVFIAENVLGVMSGKHKAYWDQLHNMLNSAGYNTQNLVLNSNLYGVPQIRKRVFLIAYKGNYPDIVLPEKQGGVLADALRSIEYTDNHIEKFLTPGTSDFTIADKIGPGQKLSNVRGGLRSVHTWDIPDVFGHITSKERALLLDLLYLRRRLRTRDFGDADPVDVSLISERHDSSAITSLIKKNYLQEKPGRRLDLVGGFNGKYRRLAIDKPSCTVDTRFGSAKHFLHPSLNRGFTVREAARIQGFPDAYKFRGTIAEQFRMIGNAVPPPLSYEIGKYVKNNFLREKNV